MATTKKITDTKKAAKSSKSKPAKATVSKSKSKQQENTEITLDLQPFLTPISIILSGVMVSLSILFSFRNSNLNTGSTTTVTPSVVAQDPSNEDPNPPATTSIDDDAILGDRSKAKVAIVEFSDYECPYCQRFHQETYDQIVAEYVDSGKAIFVFRDFPLSFHEPKATKAAIAAECVKDIAGDEKYFAFAQLYFANTAANGAGLSGTTTEKLAEQVGVNKPDFNSCIDSGKFDEEIKSDLADGQAAGVRGTPGFIIGLVDSDGNVDGVSVPGAQPFATFQSIIEEQLAR